MFLNKAVSIVCLNSNVTKVYLQKLLVKSSQIVLFFYLHFTWICVSWLTKEFWKNIHSWKCDSWFSSEVSKLTSLRNKFNLPLKYWFMEAKIVFCTWHGLQKWSKYHLHTIQTTFRENNMLVLEGSICEKQFFPCLKMHNFRVQLPK